MPVTVALSALFSVPASIASLNCMLAEMAPDVPEILLTVGGVLSTTAIFRTAVLLSPSASVILNVKLSVPLALGSAR